MPAGTSAATPENSRGYRSRLDHGRPARPTPATSPSATRSQDRHTCQEPGTSAGSARCLRHPPAGADACPCQPIAARIRLTVTSTADHRLGAAVGKVRRADGGAQIMRLCATMDDLSSGEDRAASRRIARRVVRLGLGPGAVTDSHGWSPLCAIDSWSSRHDDAFIELGLPGRGIRRRSRALPNGGRPL